MAYKFTIDRIETLCCLKITEFCVIIIWQKKLGGNTMGNDNNEKVKMRLNQRVSDESIEYILTTKQKGDGTTIYYKMGRPRPENESLEDMVSELMKSSNVHDRILKARKKIVAYCTIAFLVLIIGAIVSCFISELLAEVMITLSYVNCFAMLLSEAVAITYLRFKKDAGVEKYLKLQVAANKVRNAYFEFKRMPTIEEVKKAEGISADARYLTFTFVIPYICWLFALEVSSTTWMYIFFAWTITAAILDLKKKLGCFQYLIYSKPGEEEFEFTMFGFETMLETLPEEGNIEIVEN